MPDYTDEELFTLIELQYGKPGGTQVRSPGKKAAPPITMGVPEATTYYSNITDLLLRATNYDAVRTQLVRTAFYRKHGITTFESSPDDGVMGFKRGGPFDLGALKR